MFFNPRRNRIHFNNVCNADSQWEDFVVALNFCRIEGILRFSTNCFVQNRWSRCFISITFRIEKYMNRIHATKYVDVDYSESRRWILFLNICSYRLWSKTKRNAKNHQKWSYYNVGSQLYRIFFNVEFLDFMMCRKMTIDWNETIENVNCIASFAFYLTTYSLNYSQAQIVILMDIIPLIFVFFFEWRVKAFCANHTLCFQKTIRCIARFWKFNLKYCLFQNFIIDRFFFLADFSSTISIFKKLSKT